jgi:WD40 repeat protein
LQQRRRNTCIERAHCSPSFGGVFQVRFVRLDFAFWHCFFEKFFRDGSKVLTSSDDGSARLWSVESGQQIKEFKGHSKKLCAASFSNDGTKVLTCSEVTPVHPRTTRVWSCDSGELLLDADKTTAESTTHNLSPRPWGCESVFSPDGLHVVRFRHLPLLMIFVSETLIISLQVTVSDDRQRMRLSLASTGQESLLLGPFSETLHSFQFSDDGMLLLLCCGDGSCHIFCARSAALFLSLRSPLAVQHSSLIGHPPLSAHASFSPDCRQVVFLSGGSNVVHLHNLQTSSLQTPNKLSRKYESVQKFCILRHLIPCSPQARNVLSRSLQKVSDFELSLLPHTCILCNAGLAGLCRSPSTVVEPEF